MYKIKYLAKDHFPQSVTWSHIILTPHIDTMTTYMQEELEACREEKPINTDVKVCYDMTSHPDMLTENELESVTTVFRSFESGLRGATIHPSVSQSLYSQKRLILIYLIEDLSKALTMLGLNPTEQETVDIPNQIARLHSLSSTLFYCPGSLIGMA